jgi:dCMP deaminase
MRISSEEMYIEILKVVAKRSTCMKRSVSAIIVKEGRIISMGYNGSPRGVINCCDENKCIRESSASGENLQNCYAIHAEINAISFAAKVGIACDDSIIYTSTQPCINCAKAIISAGIKKVVYIEKYNDELSLKLLKQAGIEVSQYKED